MKDALFIPEWLGNVCPLRLDPELPKSRPTQPCQIFAEPYYRPGSRFKPLNALLTQSPLQRILLLEHPNGFVLELQ